MILDHEQSRILAREMGCFLRKFPKKALTLEEVFQLAAATDVTQGVGGKRVLLKRAGITREGSGTEIRSLDDQEWRDVWKFLSQLRREGFVCVSNEPNPKYMYDPKEDKGVKQVLTPEMAGEPLRLQIAEALVEMIYQEGFLLKDEAKKRICERFGYADIKHTLWGPLVSKCTRAGINGRVIVIDAGEKAYMVPELVKRADEVGVKAVVAREPQEVVETVKFVPSQVSISAEENGITTVTLGDGTVIVRDPSTKTITVKTKERGWQVTITNLLSLLF